MYLPGVSPTAPIKGSSICLTPFTLGQWASGCGGQHGVQQFVRIEFG